MHPVSRITAVLVTAVVIGLSPPLALSVADDLGAFSFGPRFESLGGSDVESLIERDFFAYDINYLERKAEFGQLLHDLARRLAAEQMAGNDMACSNQIFLEAKWLYHYTADWSRLDRQLRRLEVSLENPNQEIANRQSPEDGSWGVCYDEWFLKVEATFIALLALYAESKTPEHPITLGDRVNTPDKLIAYLEGLVISNVAKTGVDKRSELGSAATILTSAYFKDYLQTFLAEDVKGIPRNLGEYPVESFKTAYKQFLEEWQDPETGYWGAWYRSEDRFFKSTDLSITYHIVAYRRGDVAHWPRIIDTTFRIKPEPYPYGWLHNGTYIDHHNYDVAKIFRYGWQHMMEFQKEKARQEIQKMLNWSLSESLTPDGVFKNNPEFFSSVAADFYFGVSFLDVIGFWDPSKRFWTDGAFDNASALCCKIKRRLAALGLKAQPAQSAIDRLNGSCAVCPAQ